MSTLTGSHNCICVLPSSEELAAWDLNLVCREASLNITTEISTELESETQRFKLLYCPALLLTPIANGESKRVLSASE